MINGDWYEWMDTFESNPRNKNRYLIDCVGGKVSIYRARDSSLVGCFTAEQAKRFFYGISSVTALHNVDSMNETIKYNKTYFDETGVEYRVKNDSMTLREEYCYMVATNFDTYNYERD